MTGKRKCSLLKSIRCKIAEQNGIEFSTPECTFQGECKGTCPKCEAELRYLTEELEKIRRSGKRVAVAGIAAAMIATSASGCARQPEEYEEFTIPSTYTEEDILTGDMAVPNEPEEEFMDGDVAFPGDEEFINGSTLTGAVAPSPIPEVASFGAMDMMQISDALYGMAFLRLDTEWQAYRVFHEENERCADYSEGIVTVRVYYNERGFITEAAVTVEAGENADE